jgi:hypothetical protein
MAGVVVQTPAAVGGGDGPVHDQVLALARELRRAHLGEAGSAVEIRRLQRVAADECVRANIEAADARKVSQ